MSRLTILHLNDPHGQIRYMGYLTKLVNHWREKATHSLLLASGDLGFTAPTIFTNHTAARCDLLVSLYQRLGVDLLVPGDHDLLYPESTWDLGYMVKIGWPILCSNVKLSGAPLLSHKIIEVEGVKIGLFGLVATPDSIDDYISAAREVLNGPLAGVDYRILLSHIGVYRDILLARRLQDVNLIIGGHSHDFLTRPIHVGRTQILQAGLGGVFLGHAELDLETLDLVDYNIHSINPEVGSCPDTDREIYNFVEKHYPAFHEVLTRSNAVWGPAYRENAIGNWLCDQYRRQTKCDAFVLKSGMLYPYLVGGQVSIHDALSLQPYLRAPVTVEMPGRDIVEMLEHCLQSDSSRHMPFPEVKRLTQLLDVASQFQSINFLQQSGMRVEADMEMPPGSRIQRVEIDGRLLVDNKKYTIGTDSFLAQGTSGFHWFLRAGPKLNYFPQLENMILDSLRMTGDIRTSTDGRWKLDGLPDTPPL